MRKKLLAVLLLAALMASVFSVNTFAATTILRSENGTYSYEFKSGEEFDITFLVENNPGISSATFIVHYDPEIIQAVESSEIGNTDDYYTYKVGGNSVRLFDTDTINEQINLVPNESWNGEYISNNAANGVDTSAEIGWVKLAGLAFDGSIFEGDKNLFSMRFKMIKAGSTNVEVLGPVTDTDEVLWGADLINVITDIDIQPAKVVLTGSGSSEDDDETTTEETTAEETTSETTTSSSSSNSSTSSSSSTSSGSSTSSSSSASNSVSGDSESEDSAAEDAAQASFSDISQYPWAVNAIETLAANNIVSGVGNGQFNPSANVKRADFLIMLLNALDLDAEVTENFADVSEDKYYYEAVGKAKALGIANGLGDNMYNPESYISRQDMMVLAKRATDLKSSLEAADSSVLDKFEDKDSISSYAVESLAAMVNAGIVNGTGNNIEPKAYTTRAQAAVIIYNIYNMQ